MMGGGRRIHWNGQDVAHHTGVSCFAEYAVVDRGSVVVIDKELPLHEAALFGCDVMTGLGAVINTPRILTGERVAVVDLCGFGLTVLPGPRSSELRVGAG